MNLHRPPAPRRLALSVTLALLPLSGIASDDPYLAGLDAAGRAEFDASTGMGAINAASAYARGLDGRGIVVGIFDSGVYPDTPELAGRVSGLVNGALAPDGSPCPDSARLVGPNHCVRTEGTRPGVNFVDWDQGLFEQWAPGTDASWFVENIAGGRYATHGTHVAGIIAAARDGSGMHGVAPDATLVAGRLDSDRYLNMPYFFQQPGGLSLEREIPREGFEETIRGAAAAGVRVINHSWGFVAGAPADQAEADANYARFADKLQALADGSRRDGMLQVVAAGNDSGGVASTPADLPYYIPEVEPYWVTVVSARADGQRDSFSSTCGNSQRWCVAAPGDAINSTVVEGQVQARAARNQDGEVTGVQVDAEQPARAFAYARMTGTSQAAPQVTGALALLMQRFPYLDNPQVRDVLLTTARDLGEPGVDAQFGWGMVDLRKAVDGPGQLRVDTTVRMDRPGGGTPAWSAPAWDEWRNDIAGPGRLLKAGPGWLRLSGANRFGGATVTDGTLEFTGDNALGADVTVAAQGRLRIGGRLAGSAVNVDGGQAWIGGEVTRARLRVAQGGQLQLDGALEGALALSAASASVAGRVRGEVTLHDGASLALSPSGLIEGGTLRLAGSRADIDGRVDGPVHVDAGSWIGGDGRTGTLTVDGTVAPGHSIGTLTVDGDYVQRAGSRYDAELGLPGSSDLLHVRGKARLEGGTLLLGAPPAAATLGQRWRVLEAAQGVDGRFAALAGYLPATPFLAMAARYGGDAVEVEVARGASLASAAHTRNARSVAAAVDAGTDAAPLTQRLTRLMPAQLPAALAPLDGELHASVRALLLRDTELVRDAALARARDGQDAFTAQSQAAGHDGLWADVRQRQRRLDGDGNAGAARLDGGTLLAGYDHRFDNGWQLGVLGGTGEASARLSERRDNADVHATHLGLQAARRWGPLAWRVGAAYSAQDVRTRRDTLPSDPGAPMPAARARYDIDTAQWFTELGYRVEGTRGDIEPFAQYAGLRLRSDAAQEQGGVAPLALARARQQVDLWTGGIRAGLDLSTRGQLQPWLRLRGAVAYQRANGELTPAARMQWRDGQAFTVWGAPLARHSTLASLGLAARLSPGSLLELDWRGAFSGDARDLGIGARYSVRF